MFYDPILYHRRKRKQVFTATLFHIHVVNRTVIAGVAGVLGVDFVVGIAIGSGGRRDARRRRLGAFLDGVVNTHVTLILHCPALHWQTIKKRNGNQV